MAQASKSGISEFSLLWPRGAPPGPAASADIAALDELRIRVIAEAIAPHVDDLRPIYGLLTTLLSDGETIRYRQAVIEDCLRLPAFTEGLGATLPLIRGLRHTVSDIRARRNQVSLVLSRMTELENYIECVSALDALLQRFRGELEARAWMDLADEVRRTVQAPEFQEMAEELPALRSNIREIVSVTIGVNLSPDLKPVAATLLSLNKRRFRGPRFFRRLWGAAEDDERRGITTLHESPGAQQYRNGSVLAERRETLDRLEANVLFSDLGKVLDDVIRPIARALERYTRVNSGLLRALQSEIAFYVGGARLIEAMRARGLPMCKPELLPSAERRLEARGVFNLDLALRLSRQQRDEDLGDHIVSNDVHFDDSGRIHILTGPNRGGKTTWLGAIGLLHALAQSGLYVPAASAALSPVDAIYLHFPAEEKPNMESGRLGEEAGRLRKIFQSATRHSLLLLNESLASTSATESYFLARDILCCVRMLGARAIFVTHLHELASDCAAMNQAVSGDSLVTSLISQIEEGEDGMRPTYRVIAAPPRGQSYAREIARQYGISFEQLRALAKERARATETGQL